jgi:CHAT domain-containing protein/tetratricopeptide (TPR) repeat protein
MVSVPIALAACVLSGLGTCAANAQVVPSFQKEARVLKAGETIERTLTGTEVHHYRLELQKGQCATIRVEQRGINVVVQFLGSDENLVVEVDDALGKQGTERLDVVAENDGNYIVAIKPKVKIASGGYEIRLSAVQPATKEDRTLFEALQLRTNANRLLAADKAKEAYPMAGRALALVQESRGPDDLYVALLRREQAVLASWNGKQEEARAGLEQALNVLESTLGPEDPQTNLTKSILGKTWADVPDYSKADKLLSQALESEERTLGPEDPLLAVTLQSLGIMHLALADYTSSDREFRRTLAILEGAGMYEDIQYGAALTNLGIIYIIQHKYDKAEEYLARHLAFQEKRWGPDSPALAGTLNNLGIVARRKKDYPAAERYYQRGLAIEEKQLVPEQFGLTTFLSNLANVYSSEGQFQKALDAHLHVLSILEKESGDIAGRRLELEDIAGNYAALGDFENAIKRQSQLESTLESEVALKLAIGSERQKRAYLDSIARDMDDTLSLNLKLQPNNSEAASVAAVALLRRKGRVLDAMTDSLATLRKHSDSQDQVLLDEFKDANAQLAQVALKGAQKQSLEEYRKTIHGLQEHKEKLEKEIGYRNQEFRARLQPVTLEAVQAAIPADFALVEFVTYSPSDPKAPTAAEQYGDLRYAAYVLHRGSPPKGIDLGDAKAIDDLIEKFRAALREPSREDVKQLAQALGEKVFGPLEPLVADDKRLLISPDGQLDLIPFEALLDKQGSYLVERYSITYLTTGRDLLRMQLPRPSRSAPVLFADPFFGEPKETLAANGATTQVRPAAAITTRRSITTGADFASLYFAPLAGTKAEARSIQALFPEAQVLTGEHASEAALEELKGPKILHIATHGFFLQGKVQGKAGGEDGTSDPENPLLRSGLAVSGANLVRDSQGHGILTALQASNLDLWGTKLVTLSACDTGLGEVKNGEGVYGLRRAFFLAGAESLVMSLWPVSDYVTRDLMTQYYSGLKKGIGRGEALRIAQLGMLKRKDRQHPFYWASFIQAGEWANLDGYR